MGTFRVTIEIGDPKGERWERVEALMDTGATYTVIPASLMRRLDIRPHVRAPFLLGDGRQVEREIGRTWVRVNSLSELVLVVFGDEDGEALLGAHTLESLRLAADPVGRRLIPVPGLLASF